MAASAGDRSLEETSTWAVAVVCAVFVVISVAIEHGIESLGKVFNNFFKLPFKTFFFELLWIFDCFSFGGFGNGSGFRRRRRRQ